VLNDERVSVLPVDAAENTDTANSTTRALSGSVSWWAESVSLALGDLASRGLGHDQLQQLYDNAGVCTVTSLMSASPDDVNVSEHLLDAAAAFGR